MYDSRFVTSLDYARSKGDDRENELQLFNRISERDVFYELGNKLFGGYSIFISGDNLLKLYKILAESLAFCGEIDCISLVAELTNFNK